jgi:tRNA (guanine37-N1)-methyltransferase
VGGLLDYPHYTRPAEFRGWAVPEVLISGHHAEVDKWRRRAALRKTWLQRPDLLKNVQLTPAEQQWLAELEKEKQN